MKVRRCSCCFHRRPTVRDYSSPSTSNRRCQGWRRCGMSHQTPQRPFGRCRGQWLWMKVRRCSWCFHRRPTVHWNRIPSTSNRRCQGCRRCDSLQQTTCRSSKQRKRCSKSRCLSRCSLRSRYPRCCCRKPKQVNPDWCCFHHRLTVLWSHSPNTSGRRCQGWRRFGDTQRTTQRPYGLCQGQSLWMKVRWWPCCFHHYPTDPQRPAPNTSRRRYQEWRRCVDLQQTPLRQFGPFQGQSRWMKVRWCPCCFHHRPTVRHCPIPSTSNRRCQGWRRYSNVQHTPQRPFGLSQGQSLWMKVRWCSCCFHHPAVLFR